MTALTRETVEAMLAGELAGVTLAYSDEGYGVIYITPVENADTAVAVPARDKSMGWHKANPEVYMALVERFNAAPDLAAALLAAWDERDAVNGILLRSMDQVKTLHRAEAAEAKLAERDAEIARLRETLEWCATTTSRLDIRAAIGGVE